ncbi:type II toxin-antitoxin system RelE/ParE family toxin [Candidatus Dependentiae bacterium]|nr:type II toxin-antitoxin system RelE/ParE family toxin [Candidatus Dependentiae bacterium]
MILLKAIPIKFYREDSGKEPVYDWLMSFGKEDRKIIGYDIKRVQIGWPLGLPLVRPLGNKLWEVRITLNNRIARVIFTLKDGFIILLHAFIKKTQKTPQIELALALKRLKNI